MADGDTRVIVASRWKTLLLCLGAVAFVAIGVWLVKEHSDSMKAVIAEWAGMVFFGAAGVLGAVQVIWPSRLVLDGDGLAFHYLFATFRRRWINVGRIDVVQIKSTRIVKLIAKAGGKDLALGGAWPVSVDELVSLLENYLGRFGGTNAA